MQTSIQKALRSIKALGEVLHLTEQTAMRNMTLRRDDKFQAWVLEVSSL